MTTRERVEQLSMMAAMAALLDAGYSGCTFYNAGRREACTLAFSNGRDERSDFAHAGYGKTKIEAWMDALVLAVDARDVIL